MSTQTKTLIGCLILLTAITALTIIEDPPTTPGSIQQPKPKPVPKDYREYTIDQWINLNAERIKEDPDLINAVISVESGGDYGKISETQDYGLMQIHDAYIQDYYNISKEFNAEHKIPCNALDARANIVMGCNALQYWKEQSKKSQYTQTKYSYLGAYNNGFKGLKTPNETYIEKVLTVYNHIKDKRS